MFSLQWVDVLLLFTFVAIYYNAEVIVGKVCDKKDEIYASFVFDYTYSNEKYM